MGSSIALLSGQKPPFRLLVRAIRAASPGGGAAAGGISSAVSDDFIVATQRVKTAQKARRPPGGAGAGAGWGRPSRIGSRCRLCVPAGLPHACCRESLDRLADG